MSAALLGRQRFRLQGLRAWLGIGLLLCSASLSAQIAGTETAAIEPLERIMTTVRTFVLASLGDAATTATRIDIGQLDSRLRLARCAHLPTAQLAPGSRSLDNGTVNIRCTAPVTWSIFVPVRVEREVAAVVVTRPLSRQQVITAADVRLEATSSAQLANGYFDTPENVIGLQTKRALLPGQVLNDALLTPAKVVKRGQQVTLIVVTPGVTVQMKGEALEDGAVGQRIRVRNSTSKQIIEGEIEASGMVRLQL